MFAPEFGNEIACDNCGDEWSASYTNGLCEECYSAWLAEACAHDWVFLPEPFGDTMRCSHCQSTQK